MKVSHIGNGKTYESCDHSTIINPKRGGCTSQERSKKGGGAIVGRVFPQLWSMDFDVKLAQVVL